MIGLSLQLYAYQANKKSDTDQHNYSEGEVNAHPDWFFKQTEASPLGIIPEWLHKEKRLNDVVNEVTTLVLIDEAPNTLKRKIVSIYLSGYNLINLKSKIGRIQPIQREAVREIVRRSLIGTEIIADSSDIITIQILLTLPELSVNTAVRRMFLIASSMHRDVIIALKEKNFEIANGVIKSDDEVDRFSLYILRNLVMATNNERVLQEIGLKYPSDC